MNSDHDDDQLKDRLDKHEQLIDLLYSLLSEENVRDIIASYCVGIEIINIVEVEKK